MPPCIYSNSESRCKHCVSVYVGSFVMRLVCLVGYKLHNTVDSPSSEIKINKTKNNVT